MPAKFGTNAAEKPLRLTSSTSEAAYSTLIDALPYADESMTEGEREAVQRLIDEELAVMKREAGARRAAADVGPPPSLPVTSSTSVIDRARYEELRDVDAARVALEYEMGRHLEAQLRLKYGALSYRLSNEIRASVLHGVEERAREVVGDVGMINRERKRCCAGVQEELGRLRGAYVELVRKNHRLLEAVEEMERTVDLL